MTSSEALKGDPVKSFRFLENFDEWPLPAAVTRAKTHHTLTSKFYNSMVGYVIDRKENLSPLEIAEMQRKITIIDETQNMVRVIYKSGNVFEGPVSDWIPQNKGRLCLDGGAIYEGQLNEGVPEGSGVIKWLDGSWYGGEFLRGLRHGHGLHVSCEDGRRWYGGEWTNGKRNGRGESACCVGQPDGALNYSGDWVDGRPHGTGTAIWPDDTRYTGGWVHGRQHGHGQAVWPSDHVYEGGWVDGHMDGTGTYKWNSNPRDYDRLVVLCLCDKYTGQWSKSKKHGLGVFFSANTGATVRGRWVDDCLDGPCEIVLSTGQPPKASGLVFRNNVLYETIPVTPPSAGRVGNKLAVGRVRRVSYKPVATATAGCPLSITASGSHVQESKGLRANAELRLVRADIRLTNDSTDGAATSCGYDLTDHVLRIATRSCRVDMDLAATTSVVDLESDIRDAGCTVNMYENRMSELYRAYGSFLADGPITYRPLMTRLGLWQMIIDSRLQAHVSLADFDDLLYNNKNYGFVSAHDPFEPIYFWQFVHAVCVLATATYHGTRRPAQKANRAVGSHGCLMTSALHRLFAQHVHIDIVPTSYVDVLSDVRPSATNRWANSRKTMVTMYDVYRTMATAAEDLHGSPPPITAHQLIRLYGGNHGILPIVLDVVLGLAGEAASAAAVFQFSTSTLTTLLSEACPTAVDSYCADLPHAVALDERLTFADWYRFVLSCVRECRVPASTVAKYSSTVESFSASTLSSVSH